MKSFTDRSVTKKITIAILTVLMLTFAIPKPVSAVGGILMSPIVTLVTTLLDAGQHLLEWATIGETSSIMQDKENYEGSWVTTNSNGEPIPHTDLNEGEIDGSLWGLDDVNVARIQYTPEEIFSNRVPMLDVNFINPSVIPEDGNMKHNVASQLQKIVASWYKALRIMALVALLSVLVYIGIRMMLTSIASDRVKYKKMFMDWLVALCLLFVLHFIMSFALTMSEVVTSMIANTEEGTITVNFMLKYKSYTFSGNLMSFVRFMIQHEDKGLGYFFLYLMLIIYNVRFTWIYLKRVVNMAFLTIIAPLVAVTYPIDKAGDGKAQAFDMWIKEFVFNALLQPLHLLLYIVLLGSATELAMNNPLYAVVALGFIFAGEKLFKKMFGFDKAGAGTLGSLAGAVGVSNLASRALMGLAKGKSGGKGGSDKVRTKGGTERQGRDPGANKAFNTFDKEGNSGLDELDYSTTPPAGESGAPDGNEEYGASDTSNSNDEQQLETYDDLEQQKAELYNQGYTDDSDEIKAIQERIQNGDFAEEKPVGDDAVKEAMEELGPEEEALPETWRSLWEADEQQRYEKRRQARLDKEERIRQKRLDRESGELSRKRKVAAYKTLRGVRTALPTLGYKVAKGTAQVAAGLALGATAGVIGATFGDGEKAVAAAGTAFAVGAGTGGRAFESTVGKATGMQNRTVRDSYGAGKYGSAQDARNARADKEYIRSQAHKDEYEKYFKTGKFHMSKQDYDKAVKEYRQVGLTDTGEIRKALMLEHQYKNDGKNHGSDQDIRGKVQNIVQTYSMANKEAVMGNKKAEASELKFLESQLTKGDAKQKRAVANEILQGWRDWRAI